MSVRKQHREGFTLNTTDVLWCCDAFSRVVSNSEKSKENAPLFLLRGKKKNHPKPQIQRFCRHLGYCAAIGAAEQELSLKNWLQRQYYYLNQGTILPSHPHPWSQKLTNIRRNSPQLTQHPALGVNHHQNHCVENDGCCSDTCSSRATGVTMSALWASPAVPPLLVLHFWGIPPWSCLPCLQVHPLRRHMSPPSPRTQPDTLFSSHTTCCHPQPNSPKVTVPPVSMCPLWLPCFKE